jgi:hypothetical protein
MRLQDIMGVGQGAGDIPYDRTDPAVDGGEPAPADVMAGAQSQADPYGGANVGPTMGLAQMGGGGDMSTPVDQAGAMGAGPEDMAPTTDMLSDQELSAVDSQGAPDMEQILNDPSLSPEDRAMIEQQILMAARRQMAGI